MHHGSSDAARETIVDLLRQHAVEGADRLGRSGRFWKGTGTHSGQGVFIKAAAHPDLCIALRREAVVATEVAAAGIATLVPLLLIDVADVVVTVTEFEAAASWQFGSEERARLLTREQAGSVAEALVRLTQVSPDLVKSAPRRAPHGRELGPAFVRLAHHGLYIQSDYEGRTGPLVDMLELRLIADTRIERLGRDLEQLPPSPPIFLHGDASPANTSFRDDGTVAFFDWEWSRLEGDRLVWLGFDVMNYVTRSWANLDFARQLLGAFAASAGPDRALLPSLRAALVLQCLNKLGPSYLYPEPKWVATQERFEILRCLLRTALLFDDVTELPLS